jgi:hypothetical protein
MRALLLAAAAAAFCACSKPAEDPLKRGEYLATIGGCHDCHTPKIFNGGAMELDKARLLSGHRADASLPDVPANVIGPDQWGALANADLTAWAGPWGISYAANLTPDKKTGIGEWQVESFILAMRNGKHAGVGRPILPPMPWFNYAQMPDEDLRAVFAYLLTLPAIANKVPEPKPPAEASPQAAEPPT